MDGWIGPQISWSCGPDTELLKKLDFIGISKNYASCHMAQPCDLALEPLCRARSCIVPLEVGVVNGADKILSPMRTL